MSEPYTPSDAGNDTGVGNVEAAQAWEAAATDAANSDNAYDNSLAR